MPLVPFASTSGAGPCIRSAPGDSVEQLLGTLASVHSFWRYIVLIAAVVGLVGALGGWLGMALIKPRLAATIYIIALDIQVLLGIVLLLGGDSAALPGGLKFEHPTTMVLAAVVAHVGQVLARKSSDSKRAALTTAVAIAVSLVLVLLGIMRVTQGR
jgi:hypothetical protein